MIYVLSLFVETQRPQIFVALLLLRATETDDFARFLVLEGHTVFDQEKTLESASNKVY